MTPSGAAVPGLAPTSSWAHNNQAFVTSGMPFTGRHGDSCCTGCDHSHPKEPHVEPVRL